MDPLVQLAVVVQPPTKTVPKSIEEIPCVDVQLYETTGPETIASSPLPIPRMLHSWPDAIGHLGFQPYGANAFALHPLTIGTVVITLPDDAVALASTVQRHDRRVPKGFDALDTSPLPKKSYQTHHEVAKSLMLRIVQRPQGTHESDGSLDKNHACLDISEAIAVADRSWKHANNSSVPLPACGTLASCVPLLPKRLDVAPGGEGATTYDSDSSWSVTVHYSVTFEGNMSSGLHRRLQSAANLLILTTVRHCALEVEGVIEQSESLVMAEADRADESKAAQENIRLQRRIEQLEGDLRETAQILNKERAAKICIPVETCSREKQLQPPALSGLGIAPFDAKKEFSSSTDKKSVGRSDPLSSPKTFSERANSESQCSSPMKMSDFFSNQAVQTFTAFTASVGVSADLISGSELPPGPTKLSLLTNPLSNGSSELEEATVAGDGGNAPLLGGPGGAHELKETDEWLESRIQEWAKRNRVQACRMAAEWQMDSNNSSPRENSDQSPYHAPKNVRELVRHQLQTARKRAVEQQQNFSGTSADAPVRRARNAVLPSAEYRFSAAPRHASTTPRQPGLHRNAQRAATDAKATDTAVSNDSRKGTSSTVSGLKLASPRTTVDRQSPREASTLARAPSARRTTPAVSEEPQPRVRRASPVARPEGLPPGRSTSANRCVEFPARVSVKRASPTSVRQPSPIHHRDVPPGMLQYTTERNEQKKLEEQRRIQEAERKRQEEIEQRRSAAAVFYPDRSSSSSAINRSGTSSSSVAEKTSKPSLGGTPRNTENKRSIQPDALLGSRRR